jgi:hypothetical protein
VRKAYVLADGQAKVEVAQSADESIGHHELTLKLPRRKPDPHVSVVVLEIRGDVDVDPSPIQQPDGTIRLPAHMADLHVPKGNSRMHIGRGGLTENWHTKSNWLSWDFKVSQPGRFVVKVHTARRHQAWVGGHKVKVTVGRQSLTRKLRADEMVDIARARHQPEAASVLGTVTIDEAGTCMLKLRAEAINPLVPQGLGVCEVRLEPKQ